MGMWKRAVSGALALVLSLWVLTGGLPLGGERAGAVTQAEIDAMKGQISEISNKINGLKEELKSIQDDKAQALQQKQYLDEQIFLIDQRIGQLDTILAQYDQLIGEKQLEVEALQEKEGEQYDLFCQRVRAMEEQGTVSYLAILFNAASFSELLNNAMMIGEIMDYDNRLIEVLQATRREVEAAQLELEGEKAEQQMLRDEQEAARADLEAQEAAAAQLVANIALQEGEYQAAIQQMRAEEAQVEKEMKQALRELEEARLRAQQQSAANVVSESGFLWPLTGRYTLTSKFGWRTSPITGRSEYHLGTDIPAPRNTPILAAKSGVVTTSKLASSYGNYVVVTHSDGYQTLYAHMNSRAVSVGDAVTQGQTIGYVGTTGDSTGNHLHFEVWKNGSRTNAEDYFDLPFVRRY